MSVEQEKIEDILAQRYFDYASYVITDRAIPNIYDGLKPVARRSLYALYDLKIFSNQPTRKCVKTVGHIIGSFHPHGDSSAYGALVRLTQPWSMRIPFVFGQGNFGSVEGDPPAAMRYTECRLEKITEQAVLADLDKDVVIFEPTFDNENQEPIDLPVRFPNALVNPNSGMAVGVSSDILPHNLNECIDATIALITNAIVTNDELMKIVRAPDFPGGGIIETDNYKEVWKMIFETGKGSVRLSARFEETKIPRYNAVRISEFPYGVLKGKVLAEISTGVKKGRIPGVMDILDESDANASVLVLKFSMKTPVDEMIRKLKSATSLSKVFPCQMVYIVDGKPKQLGIRSVLEYFLQFRRSCISRRVSFELRELQNEAHIVEGFIRVFEHLDRVIEIVRTDTKPKETLMREIGLDEIQVEKVLDMPLRRLSKLDENLLRDKYQKIQMSITEKQGILADAKLVDGIIKQELLEVKKKFSSPRKTKI
jgi:DNA gyrase subunit A